MALISRRRVCGAAFFALAFALVSMPAVAAGDLRFLTWADYIAPEVITAFEKETGTRIIVSPVHSDKAFIKELTGGGGGYDLATPLDFQMSLLVRSSALDKINASSLKGYLNVEEAWRGLPYDKRNDYSIPFMWGTTSIVVDTAVYNGDINTYKLLFDPPEALKGRISLLIGTAEAMRMGLTYLGLPACSKEPDDIQRVIALFRPLINPDLIANISTIIPILTGDRAVIGLAWNGDALRARLKKPSLRYAYPREGTFMWADTLVVPQGAPNRAAAIAFISFMLRPEVAAMQSNFTHYANTIAGSDSFLAPILLEAPEVIVPTGVKINFRQFCDHGVVEGYVEAWDRMLADYKSQSPNK